MLIRYGAKVLEPDEYKDALKSAVAKYVWFLGKQRFKPSRYKDAQFHAFHRADIDRMLAELGNDPPTRRALQAARMLLRKISVNANTSKAAGDETGKSPDPGQRILNPRT
jgi:hypothetical protein